jgi:AraC family transcriptional regulator of arabinose operon
VIERLKKDSARAWTLPELAKLAGLSTSRFRTVFRQVTGTSTVRYLNWLRINRARALLMEGDYTVTEAAEAVGFSDVYYFSRLFRKMTGTNPSTYRVGD